MFLKSLYLHRFRAFDETFLEFSPGINWIWGGNATGKTSILEAIYYLITGKSFRNAGLQDLIKSGEERFFIEASFVKNGITQRLRAYGDSKERKFFLNSNPLASVSQLLGVLQGVVMTPDDVSLIKGHPQGRRNFLDIQLVQADPLYVYHLTRYSRALRQRNCLLKSKQVATIESWEHELATSAAYMTLKRNTTLSELDHYSRRYHQQLTDEKEHSSLKYYSHLAGRDPKTLAESLIVQYQKMRRREMEVGMTLTGPHRDDFGIFISDLEARHHASEGQQRTFAASVKFAEWQRLTAQAGEASMMFGDDVGIGMDAARCRELLKLFDGCGQVFLTSTQEPPSDVWSKELRIFGREK